MGSPLLRVLNMPDVSEWDKVRHLPRFMQPVEFSLAPCTHCRAPCCWVDVELTTVEAARIALNLALPFDDVVTRHVLREGEERLSKNLPIPLVDGPTVLRLKRRANSECNFLNYVGERGRCAIHGLRPGICRLYPYEVQWGRRHVRVGSQSLCPVRWLKDDAAEARLRENLTQIDADRALERKLLTSWKRRRGERTWQAYVPFAVRKLAPELGASAEEYLREPRRTLGKRLW
ncbi:MAG: YkgJ family cysteine cluster protein [Myxococcota bacterium]